MIEIRDNIALLQQMIAFVDGQSMAAKNLVPPTPVVPAPVTVPDFPKVTVPVVVLVDPPVSPPPSPVPVHELVRMSDSERDKLAWELADHDRHMVQVTWWYMGRRRKEIGVYLWNHAMRERVQNAIARGEYTFIQVLEVTQKVFTLEYGTHWQESRGAEYTTREHMILWCMKNSGQFLRFLGGFVEFGDSTWQFPVDVMWVKSKHSFKVRLHTSRVDVMEYKEEEHTREELDELLIQLGAIR